MAKMTPVEKHDFLKGKQTGRQVFHYANQTVSVKAKIGYIKLSQTNVFIKSNVEKVQFVRVVPKKHKITVEIGYKKRKIIRGQIKC